MHIAQRFAQPLPNKFDGVPLPRRARGVPLIDNAAAQLECRNETRYYSGDHVIFIGHVLHYAWPRLRAAGVLPGALHGAGSG